MFLQNQRDRSAQTRHTRFGKRRSYARRISDQRRSRHLRLNNRAQLFPVPRHVSHDDNLLRRQPGHHHAHSATDGMRHALQGAGRQGVPGLCQ